MKSGKNVQKSDPFVTEIIRSGIIATTDEMKNNLMRTAYNAIVYEALDFTVALTDSKGNLVSIGLGLPSFIRGISDTVKAMLKHFGTDIHPGDVLLTNDAYTHGSHLNHVIMALPVFSDGEVVGYSCSEPHWADIGGVMAGSTTDIYAEGLQLPYLKIYEKGEINKDVIDIIRMNVRNPELAMGDFRGQVACCKTGEKRVLHMVNKYGKGTFARTLDALMDQAEDFSRREISKIPGGTYEAEQFMDDDGVDIGVPVPIKIKITVNGDRMKVDLSGVGRQGRGYYNSAAGVSGAQMGFKTVVCPKWFPVNDGAFRPVEVVLPPGTAVSATRPAAMRWWMTIPMTIADTMWKAMAQAVPDKIAAGHHADLVAAFAFPIDPVTKRPMNLGGAGVGGTGLAGGGFGAVHDHDGMSATVCLNDGDTHNSPIEASEAKSWTILAVKKELRQDSGGAGKFRGGLGVATEVLHFTDSNLNSFIERAAFPPWGAEGAKPALGNRLRIAAAKERLPKEKVMTSEVLEVPVDYEEYPNEKRRSAKMYGKILTIGSRVTIMVGGGGGFGNPLERDPERVLDDVVNGYVSVEAAKKDYGVAVNPSNWTVDKKETEALRKGAAR